MSTTIEPRVAQRNGTRAATLHVFTSESVSEGHPDKVCDFIADSVLDAHLAQDPASRVACEVLCKDGEVVLAGEITSRARVDHVAVAREAIRTVGYVDPSEPFHADGVRVTELISRQAPEIAEFRKRHAKELTDETHLHHRKRHEELEQLYAARYAR